jgi:hypothetical protein
MRRLGASSGMTPGRCAGMWSEAYCEQARAVRPPAALRANWSDHQTSSWQARLAPRLRGPWSGLTLSRPRPCMSPPASPAVPRHATPTRRGTVAAMRALFEVLPAWSGWYGQPHVVILTAITLEYLDSPWRSARSVARGESR